MVSTSDAMMRKHIVKQKHRRGKGVEMEWNNWSSARASRVSRGEERWELQSGEPPTLRISIHAASKQSG